MSNNIKGGLTESEWSKAVALAGGEGGQWNYPPSSYDNNTAWHSSPDYTPPSEEYYSRSSSCQASRVAQLPRFDLMRGVLKMALFFHAVPPLPSIVERAK
ncbi:MAG: hypothetical protein COV45_07625 [Deltaproteobacteria bacterium CG11_big_fil_rev_8_21_14_0_20_47_16]|nr:MAG: hypothetical protein COV45_07625 [Deltaproteobacteria bacterium CG11_big_fil_rev_8_21_14_0_20_47_16]